MVIMFNADIAMTGRVAIFTDDNDYQLRVVSNQYYKYVLKYYLSDSKPVYRLLVQYQKNTINTDSPTWFDGDKLTIKKRGICHFYAFVSTPRCG